MCYGCHKGGDVINLAKLLYNVGFKDAIARLNDQFKLVWYGVGSEDFLHDDVVRNREYLDAKGIKHEDMNTGGGHTWMNARAYLNATLQKFFK